MGRKPAGIGLASPPFGVATALAALLGALAVHALPALPPRWLDAALAVLAAALLLRPRLRLPGCVLLGFAWCALRADVALEARLPRELEGRDFTVVGTVEDLPKRQPDATRFELRVERARLDGRELALQGRLRLSWYDGAPQELDACSRWQLQLRLRRPRGLVNRGGFDSERHALEHGIVAVGYVREADSTAASASAAGVWTGCANGSRTTSPNASAIHMTRPWCGRSRSATRAGSARTTGRWRARPAFRT